MVAPHEACRLPEPSAVSKNITRGFANFQLCTVSAESVAELGKNSRSHAGKTSGQRALCIGGAVKSPKATESAMRGQLSTCSSELNAYRVVYAVHEILNPTSSSDAGESLPMEQSRSSTRFIGLVSLKSLHANSLALPTHLTLPVSAATMTLAAELAYAFLPFAWGKGYATEAVRAVLEVCKKARHLWAPYTEVNVRAIVNEANPASLRVMAKTGMIELGVHEWIAKTDEEAVFLAGEWRTRDKVHVFGTHLLG
ncbi:hypothetical protein LTS18_015075 [Coniosporium uncinatum]|uniref:Uncharacterized protein n=1 Tax=Coniosporium uncinatum TaxID=93489 RepID=A0ACC3DBX3_9PEZI|nr:hypothetical protein LTS18_015075 [Coniosporium uncinatum]